MRSQKMRFFEAPAGFCLNTWRSKACLMIEFLPFLRHYGEILLGHAGKKAHLGCHVFCHVLVIVQMVGSDIHEDCHIGMQGKAGLQLKA